MRGNAFIHFVCGSRRVNIRLGVLLLIPKSPQVQHYWHLTIRLFNVINQDNHWGVEGLTPSAEMQSVDSTASDDWEN